MKHLDSNPLVNENLGRYRGEPKHARCYCVATAAGVATVVGGVAAAGSAVVSATSDKGGGAAGGGGSPAALYGSKIKMPEYENNVNLPSYDAAAGANDYLAMLPQLRGLATSITKAGIKERNRVMPGSSTIMQNAATNLIAMSRGQIGADVMDVTNQAVAERTGGGVDPSSPSSYAGSGSQAATDFARNIGRTSQQNVNDFLSAAPTWEAMADKFAYTPDEAVGTALDLLKSRHSYILGAGELQKGIDENMYSSALNMARGIAAPNPQAVGARNDALLQQSMQQMQGGSQGNYLTAINGVVSGLSTAMGGYKQMNTTSTANMRPGPQPGTYYV